MNKKIDKLIKYYKSQQNSLKINYQGLRDAWHKNRLNAETEAKMSEFFIYKTFIRDLEELKNEL